LLRPDQGDQLLERAVHGGTLRAGGVNHPR
jgi:hypothetical protein